MHVFFIFFSFPLASGRMFVFMRDCTLEDLSSFTPPLASPLSPSLVHPRIQLAGLVLRPLNATSTEVTMLANVDPCLASLPYWLLNFATRNALPLMFSYVSRCSFHERLISLLDSLVRCLPILRAVSMQSDSSNQTMNSMLQ